MPILFVLESPGKVKNVQKYLGDEYQVSASVGHIRTLGTNDDLGVDKENQFTPTYIVDPKKSDVVSKLKSQARKSDAVYLAADWDREGEAIAWHVKEVLGLGDGEYKRIRFREITKPAIEAGIADPGTIDMNMVYSQQARTVLDKVIGYKVSPCLWKEFKNYKLSAGRVQSVAVRLIVEREQEIDKFTAQSFYATHAGFALSSDKINVDKPDIQAECDTNITDVNEASNIINNTDSGLATYWVDDLKKANTKRNPAPPFITSSLQQEASNKLSMSPEECMSHAQKLYEAGLITYMRTDSYVISKDAVKSIGDFILSQYGDKYYSETGGSKAGKAKGGQEAHEAIRPTDVKVRFATGQTARAAKLYDMIWKRTVASRMTPAQVEIKTVKIGMRTDACNPKINGKYTFVSKLEKILFEGYLRVYDYGPDGDVADGEEPKTDNQRLEQLFAKIKVGQQVWCASMTAKEKDTKPANGRYTEAGLIKKLEDEKIGRPSTYASIVSKIKEKLYVEMKSLPAKPKEYKVLGFRYPDVLTVETETRNVSGENNKLFPTGLGTMTCGFLVKTFDKLMDYKFTAEVEELLDNIASGSVKWYTVVGEVWNYLYPIIDKQSSMLASKGGNANKRILGEHPDTGLEICVIKTRYGWSICESNPVKTKSRWVSLGVRDPDSINLDTALSMLIYPKLLGEYNSKPVTLNKAKSVYIAYDDKNYSIDIYNSMLVPDNSASSTAKPTGRGKRAASNAATKSTAKMQQHPDYIADPELVDLPTAIRVIDAVLKYKAGKQATAAGEAGSASAAETKTFDGVTDYKILNGRYGYYIKYLETYNIPLPTAHKSDISMLTREIADDSIKKFLSKKPAAAAGTTPAAKPKATRAPRKKKDVSS
jgi:DNA topoisomerase-1